MTVIYTFNRYEKAEGLARNGSPVESYLFASSDFDIERDGLTYTAQAIRFSGLGLTGDKTDASVKLVMPKTNSVALAFIDGGPSTPFWVKAQAIQENGSLLTIFNGRIRSVVFDELTAEVECASIGEVLKRVGLRQQFSAQCQHSLFSSQCGVSAAANTFEFLYFFNISDVLDSGLRLRISESFISSQGVAITGPELENGYLSIDGKRYTTIVRATNLDGVIELYLLNKPSGLVLDQPLTIQVLRGCDKSPSTCLNKFNNINNFGGFPNVPQKDPFANGVV